MLLNSFSYVLKLATVFYNDVYAIDVSGLSLSDIIDKTENIDEQYTYSCRAESDDGVLIWCSGPLHLERGRLPKAADEAVVGGAYSELLDGELEYNGTVYNVVGIVKDYSRAPVIFLKDNAPANIECGQLIFISNAQRPRQLNEQIIAEFGKSRIIQAERESFFTAVMMVSEFWLYLFLSVLVVLCIGFALSYVLKKFSRDFQIIKMLGYNESALIKDTLLFFAMIISVIYIIVSLIFGVLDAVWLKTAVVYGVTVEYRLRFSQYVIMLVLLLAAYLAYLCLPIIKIVEKNIEVTEND